MRFYGLQCAEKILILLIGCFLLLGLGVSQASAGEIPGYLSTNASDLPPNPGERDVSVRSEDPDRPPAYGPQDAKVLIAMFADFECPACRRASQATHQIAGEFPGEVRIEFWNNPLNKIHRGAALAAAAGISAQRQGHFWEMHDLLFENPKHDMETILQHAKQLGLDMDKFAADIDDPAVKRRIVEESELAQALGAPSTPGYVINGKVAMGWASWRNFRSTIERELATSNALAKQGLNPLEIQKQRAMDYFADSESYELYLTRILAPNFASKSE